MKFVSLCSGIEAASVAWLPLGWQCMAVAEIEPFPCAVLKHRYRDVPNLGDMTKITAEQLEELEAEALIAGCPCQSFSVAGLRGGLNDARGNLTLTYVKLVRSTRSLRWALYENVPGILSDKTNAFGCLLAGLVGADAALVPSAGQRWTDAGVVSGPLGTASWRILDSQFFGVAQRRRRVFVLFSRGAGNFASARALFPLRESVRGNPAPSREAGKGLAPGVGKSLASSDGGIDREDRHTLIPETVGTLSDGAHNGGGSTVRTLTPDESSLPDVAWALQHRDSKGPDSDTKEGHLIPMLRKGGDDDMKAIAIQERAICENPLAGPDGIGVRTDDTAYTLEARQHPQAVAFKPSHYTRGKDGAPSEVFPPLSKEADRGDQEAVIFESRFARNGRGAPEEISPPLKAQSVETGKGDGSPCILSRMAVRRLTPRECERLQAFPDDWTEIPYGKKATTECPDGPRYKSLGNSMTTYVIRWLGQRIDVVEKGET